MVNHNAHINKEPKKSYNTILEEQIEAGLRELTRPGGGLFISGLSAGLDIGFSLFLTGIMVTLVEGSLSRPLKEILVANMYSVGFIFVVLGRSELFTEHTTLAVLPVLHGRASIFKLSRLWIFVYFSNILGAALFAAFTVLIGPALQVIDKSAFHEIAAPIVSHSWWVILVSAILAGWLMGLLSWLVTASRETISQIFVVWLITTTIGLAHFHHAIEGTVTVLAGVFSSSLLTTQDFGYFLFWTTLGNAIGGVFFVALIKYSHAIRSN